MLLAGIGDKSEKNGPNYFVVKQSLCFMNSFHL